MKKKVMPTEVDYVERVVEKRTRCIIGWGAMWYDVDKTHNRVTLLAKDLKSLADQWKRLYPRGPKFNRKFAKRIAIFAADSVTSPTPGAAEGLVK